MTVVYRGLLPKRYKNTKQKQGKSQMNKEITKTTKIIMLENCLDINWFKKNKK